MSMNTLELAACGPVIPVIVIDRVEDAVPLARALVAGGVRVLEVTLRTPAALDAIRAMSGIEGGVVGAGTVLDRAQAKAAVEAGAKFLVSPGATDDLLDAAIELGVPLLPGIATASEAMVARAKGYRIVKFFPAGPAGGPKYLQALASPLGDMVFCPTGGIDARNLPDYIAAGAAFVGIGGKLVDEALIAAGDRAAVQRAAEDALGIVRT